MFEIIIKMNPQSGEIQFGHSEGISSVVLLGMLEVTKSLILTNQVKPKESSPLITPATSLRLS